MPDYPKPPFFPKQKQAMPGSTAPMKPRPDHGETSYKGSGRLQENAQSSPVATAVSGEPSP
jgi:hypothetical protein